MSYEFRNDLHTGGIMGLVELAKSALQTEVIDLRDKLKALRATSETQSKHLAQALKEKNDLVDKLYAEKRISEERSRMRQEDYAKHMKQLSDQSRDHDDHLRAVRADVDLWYDRAAALKQQLDLFQKRYFDVLAQTVADVHLLQPPAPIIIESKALFEQNQSLQKDNEALRKQNAELTKRNDNQITMVQRYRDEAGQLRDRISAVQAALVQS